MRMQYENIDTAVIDTESLPWIPFLPYADNVFLKLLKVDAVRGEWITLLKVPEDMQLPKHHHSGTVMVYTLSGKWRYLEHDWIAEEGSFVYEPPGEIHTLTVPADCPEMITFFNISGAMIYLDEHGAQNGYEDVWTKIDMCRAHYDACGLGAAYVDQYVR